MQSNGLILLSPVDLGMAAGLVLLLAALSWNQVLAPLWRLRRPRDLVARIEKDGDFANILVAGEESLRLPGRWSRRRARPMSLILGTIPSSGGPIWMLPGAGLSRA